MKNINRKNFFMTLARGSIITAMVGLGIFFHNKTNRFIAEGKECVIPDICKDCGEFSDCTLNKKKKFIESQS